MQRLLFSLLITFSFSLSLFASTTQEHLLLLSPSQDADNVKTNSLVEVIFDREMLESSVDNDTITLIPINPQDEQVSATVTISNASTLVLTPNELLKEGQYRVTVKAIKLKAGEDDFELSSFMKKLLYWLCSWFHDDISECPLYKKFYKVPSFIKTKTIQYNFTVVDKPELLSIQLNTTLAELNVGEKLQLNAVASYDNNISKDVSKTVTWSIDNPLVASIDTNATLNAIQEGSAQITATLENITSQTLLLSVRKVINGHVLPPMPNKTLNDATLLGIDSNNNGVRDDVEIWIYETYKDKHPIHIDIAMQAGRAYKLVLETPEKAKEIYHEVDKAAYCELYYMYDADEFNETLLVTQEIDDGYFRHKTYLNTKERVDAYLQYDHLLSGGSYTLPQSEKMKAMCDFNTSKYEK